MAQTAFFHFYFEIPINNVVEDMGYQTINQSLNNVNKERPEFFCVFLVEPDAAS